MLFLLAKDKEHQSRPDASDGTGQSALSFIKIICFLPVKLQHADRLVGSSQLHFAPGEKSSSN